MSEQVIRKLQSIIDHAISSAIRNAQSEEEAERHLYNFLLDAGYEKIAEESRAFAGHLSQVRKANAAESEFRVFIGAPKGHPGGITGVNRTYGSEGEILEDLVKIGVLAAATIDLQSLFMAFNSPEKPQADVPQADVIEPAVIESASVPDDSEVHVEYRHPAFFFLCDHSKVEKYVGICQPVAGDVRLTQDSDVKDVLCVYRNKEDLKAAMERLTRHTPIRRESIHETKSTLKLPAQ